MRNPFTFLGKRARAKRANERAGVLREDGFTDEAIREYERSIRLDPKWSVPVYNLGLAYKYSGDWELSLEHNLRATRLAPGDQAGWWNLGIAATAIGRWDVARMAWRGAGIDVPEGNGPIDYPCGTSPIRLNPSADAEVVWAERIDPARAVLRSIPFPDSGFRFGDIVLNDGAPTGYRQLDGREVAVLDCLALLDVSQFSTWVMDLEFHGVGDTNSEVIERLSELATERDLMVEDWTTSIRLLCKACSEGRPHDEHDHGPSDTEPRHRVAIAAPDSEHAQRLIDDWKQHSTEVTVLGLELALERIRA